MRLNTLAIAGIAVLSLTATACKSSSHAAAAAPVTNAPATQTQADDTTSASSSPSIVASPATSVTPSPAAPSSATASSAPAAPAGSELNACSLLTGAQASSLTGRDYGAGAASTIANGQDQCTYPYSGPSVDLVVIVYEPSSGVSWNIMQSVLSGVGTVTSIPGVGDKAMFAGVELDVATGKWLIAIQGADGLNKDAGAIAIGKALVSALASK